MKCLLSDRAHEFENVLSDTSLRCSRTPRCGAVDLTDADAHELLEAHVLKRDCSENAIVCQLDIESRPGASWRDLWHCRHFLTNLVGETKGYLPRMERFEQQLHERSVLEGATSALLSKRTRWMLDHG